MNSPQTMPAPSSRDATAVRAGGDVWAGPAWLPWLFLAYAIPAIVFLSISMPPFQVADELNHALRADQISHGSLLSKQLGGPVDADLAAFGSLYQNMWFHPEVKQTVELARQAGAARWSGSRQEVNFQNTAQYGPLLYFPQA